MSLAAYVVGLAVAAIGAWIAWSLTGSLVAMGLTLALAAASTGAWAGYAIARGKAEMPRRRPPAWQLAARALGTTLAIVALFAVGASLVGVEGEDRKALRLTALAIAVLGGVVSKDVYRHRAG